MALSFPSECMEEEILSCVVCVLNERGTVANAISVWCTLFCQVALVALEKSLLVRERILHPFNKDLLRTLR